MRRGGHDNFLSETLPFTWTVGHRLAKQFSHSNSLRIPRTGISLCNCIWLPTPPQRPPAEHRPQPRMPRTCEKENPFRMVILGRPRIQQNPIEWGPRQKLQFWSRRHEQVAGCRLKLRDPTDLQEVFEYLLRRRGGGLWFAKSLDQPRV